MRVNHRSTNVSVAQQLLDGPNVITIFEQVSGEGMAKGMTAGRLGYSRLHDGVADGLLQN